MAHRADGGVVFFEQPHCHMVAPWWRDASKPLERRHSTMVAYRGEPPPRMADVRCRAGIRSAASHKRDADGRTTAVAADLPEAWNRIKASLSVFQRREVKVLGFSVKVRPRPQRMALRRYYDPFALVGASGKACGEAVVCLFSGTPPVRRGCLPLAVGCVDRVDVLTRFMC